MGLHITMVLLRADDSEHFETDPRYKSQDPEDLGNDRSYLRGNVLHDKYSSQDFLLLDRHACPWHDRGLPDWLNPEQFEALRYGCDPTWFTIQELMSVDWDAPLRPWPDPYRTQPDPTSRREKLGEDFIEWARRLQEAGVTRIALSAS